MIAAFFRSSHVDNRSTAFAPGAGYYKSYLSSQKKRDGTNMNNLSIISEIGLFLDGKKTQSDMRQKRDKRSKRPPEDSMGRSSFVIYSDTTKPDDTSHAEDSGSGSSRPSSKEGKYLRLLEAPPATPRRILPECPEKLLHPLMVVAQMYMSFHDLISSFLGTDIYNFFTSEERHTMRSEPIQKSEISSISFDVICQSGQDFRSAVLSNCDFQEFSFVKVRRFPNGRVKTLEVFASDDFTLRWIKKYICRPRYKAGMDLVLLQGQWERCVIYFDVSIFLADQENARNFIVLV